MLPNQFLQMIFVVLDRFRIHRQDLVSNQKYLQDHTSFSVYKHLVELNHSKLNRGEQVTRLLVKRLLNMNINDFLLNNNKIYRLKTSCYLVLIAQCHHPIRLKNLHPMDFVSFIYKKNINFYELYSLILNLYLFFLGTRKRYSSKHDSKENTRNRHDLKWLINTLWHSTYYCLWIYLNFSDQTHVHFLFFIDSPSGNSHKLEAITYAL